MLIKYFLSHIIRFYFPAKINLMSILCACVAKIMRMDEFLISLSGFFMIENNENLEDTGHL